MITMAILLFSSEYTEEDKKSVTEEEEDSVAP